jgi:hypothetical protein
MIAGTKDSVFISFFGGWLLSGQLVVIGVLKESLLHGWIHWGQAIVWPVDILQVEQGKENKQKEANETKGQQKQAKFFWLVFRLNLEMINNSLLNLNTWSIDILQQGHSWRRESVLIVAYKESTRQSICALWLHDQSKQINPSWRPWITYIDISNTKPNTCQGTETRVTWNMKKEKGGSFFTASWIVIFTANVSIDFYLAWSKHHKPFYFTVLSYLWQLVIWSTFIDT